MSIFDKLKSTAGQAVTAAAKSIGSKRETFTFASLPESLAEMQALPEARLDTPFKTAALTVLALCAYRHSVACVTFHTRKPEKKIYYISAADESRSRKDNSYYVYREIQNGAGSAARSVLYIVLREIKVQHRLQISA